VPNRLLLGILASLLACCAHSQRGPDGEPLWLEARTESFIVLSDGAPADVESAARKLEQVKAALLASSWSAAARPLPPQRLILLADLSDLREVLGRSFSGFATQDLFGRTLLLAGLDEASSDAPVLVHELAHAIHRGFLLRAPRWLSEGLATYLETLHLEGDGQTALLGNPAKGRLAALGSGVLRGQVDVRLGWLLRMDAGLFALPPEQVADWYARAWLFTHFLVDQKPRELGELLSRLARAEEPAAAFAAAFPGATLESLEQEIQAWLRDGRLGTKRVPVPAVALAVQTRQLSKAEALSARAELLRLSSRVFHAEGAKARALELARRAHEAEPGLADPVALLAALGDLQGPARLLAAREVAQAHADDWRGQVLLAEALSADKESPERLRALEKAAALGTTEAGPLNSLAWYRASHGEAKRALPLAEKAAQLAPGNAAILDTLAVALAGVGRCADAVTVNRRSLEVVPDGAGAAMVETLRGRADQLAQECKARAAAQAAPTAPPPPVLSAAPPQAKRSKCKTAGPLVTAGRGVTEDTVLRVRYQVTAAGRMAAFTAPDLAPAAAVKAVKAFLEGCRFELPPGAQAPLPMEEEFSFGPQK
jgi:tetratricopeptide (TPR) repeat protein